VTKKQVVPYDIPRRIKARATKANPKIAEKEWAPLSPPSSSSSETTLDIRFSPL